MFDFQDEIDWNHPQIETTYLGKPLILKDIYRYEGPITLQYLPYGGIQAVFHYHLIIHTKSGFIACDQVIYNGVLLSSEEFIRKYPHLVNHILPS